MSPCTNGAGVAVVLAFSFIQLVATDVSSMSTFPLIIGSYVPVGPVSHSVPDNTRSHSTMSNSTVTSGHVLPHLVPGFGDLGFWSRAVCTLQPYLPHSGSCKYPGVSSFRSHTPPRRRYHDESDSHSRPLASLIPFSLVAVASSTQHLEDFKRNTSAVRSVDSQSCLAGSAAAVGLAYWTCMTRCGTDWETFGWKDFAQLFVS